MTIALLFSLGTCNVQIETVRVNFAFLKRLFNLSAEVIMNGCNARLCAKCAIFSLTVKRISSSYRLVKGFKFLKRTQSQIKMLMEMCIVLAGIVSTERNANLLTVMKQPRDPFVFVETFEPGCVFTKFLLCYKARKDDKNRQNTFFLLKKDELGTQQTKIT